MKILTLNTHSLQEENYEAKQETFIEFVLRERPDLLALQEVNQSADAQPMHDFCGMMALPGVRIPLREDNHALRIARRLGLEGISASWAYLPVKLGYGKYDEGLAIMCLNGGLIAADACTISRTDDYRNWRTRKALGVRMESRPDWFYTVHMGWWQDSREPFEAQWARLDAHLAGKRISGRVWLMGDFNAPADVRDQGYDRIAQSGWWDAWLLAGGLGAGYTVRGAIDGWRVSADDCAAARGMRIDHIWCSENAGVKSCRVVFDGEQDPVVSDHFGILMETKD